MENVISFSYNIAESNIMFWLKARRENSNEGRIITGIKKGLLFRK